MTSKKLLYSGIGLIVFLTSSCSSHKSAIQQETISTPNASTDKTPQPFVEAYLEYVGPPVRWAGPPSLLIHVVAKDTVLADVLFNNTDVIKMPILEKIRAGGSADSYKSKTEVSVAVAREQLNDLSKFLQDRKTAFFGCLTPVRMRLIRADGSVTEREDCRDQGVWPKTVAETLSGFMNTAFLYRERLEASAPNPPSQGYLAYSTGEDALE